MSTTIMEALGGEELDKHTVSSLRLVLLALLGLGAAAVLVMASLPSQASSVFRNYLNDVGHVFVFCISTIATFGFLALWKLSGRVRLVISVAISFVFGVGIEFVQHFIPSRSASWQDVARDTLGIIAGLFLILAITRHPPRRLDFKNRKAISLSLAAICLGIGLIPMMQCLLCYHQRNRDFPIMLSATHQWRRMFLEAASANFWEVDVPADWPQDVDRRGIHVNLVHPRKFSGIGLRDPSPNWTEFSSLTFDLYLLDDQPCELTLLVRDEWTIRSANDQYSRRFTLEPGFQTIEVPMRDILNGPPIRQLDLENIDSVYLFAPNTTRDVNFILDNLRLR